MNHLIEKINNKLSLIKINEDRAVIQTAVNDFNITYLKYKDAVQKYGDSSPQVEQILATLKKQQEALDSIKEDSTNNYKDPYSGNRQKAEDALYHTIHPLTNSPRWTSRWTSASAPPDDFVPGGEAPRWTPEEIIFAMAGDPSMLFSGRNNHPRSPHFGNRGGSPLLRKAMKLARIYSRPNDRQLIQDLYQNGFIPLLRMMQPGFDEGRSPFISYVMRNIESAMGHGTGSTKRSQAALGYENEDGIVGFNGLLQIKDPKRVREVAEQIGVRFRNRATPDKDPLNPFGTFSASFYQLAIKYAEALESGDEQNIKDAIKNIENQIELLRDEETLVLGVSTGVGQAISTNDRKTSIDVGSLDAGSDSLNSSGTNDKSMAANIQGSDEGQVKIAKAENMEVISLMLERAMSFNFSTLGPKYKKMAEELGAKGAVKFTGPLSITQLRYTIRTLGESAQLYPGKGKIRQNLGIPRESNKWCSFGEDPEIEPIPGSKGAIWKSAWARNGYPSMGSTDIAREMTDEVKEFEKLGIATARTVKSKSNGKEEVVSKISVSNTIAAAKIKLMVLADIERDLLGIDESKLSGPLLEDLKYADKIDREIIAEACDFVVQRLDEALSNDHVVVFNKLSADDGLENVSYLMRHVDSIY